MVHVWLTRLVTAGEDSKGEDISNAFARLKKTGPAAKEV